MAISTWSSKLKKKSGFLLHGIESTTTEILKGLLKQVFLGERKNKRINLCQWYGYLFDLNVSDILFVT